AEAGTLHVHRGTARHVDGVRRAGEVDGAAVAGKDAVAAGVVEVERGEGERGAGVARRQVDGVAARRGDGRGAEAERRAGGVLDHHTVAAEPGEAGAACHRDDAGGG